MLQSVKHVKSVKSHLHPRRFRFFQPFTSGQIDKHHFSKFHHHVAIVRIDGFALQMQRQQTVASGTVHVHFMAPHAPEKHSKKKQNSEHVSSLSCKVDPDNNTRDQPNRADNVGDFSNVVPKVFVPGDPMPPQYIDE